MKQNFTVSVVRYRSFWQGGRETWGDVVGQSSFQLVPEAEPSRGAISCEPSWGGVVSRDMSQLSFDTCAIAQHTAVMKAPTGPDQCYCLTARRGARHLSRIYDRHLAPAGLSISQFSILALIELHPHITIMDLANRMLMERTTLLRALKPLREGGFLVSESAGPKTTILLTLARAGEQKLAEATPYWEAAQREYEAEVGARRATGLRDEVLGILFPR